MKAGATTEAQGTLVLADREGELSGSWGMAEPPHPPAAQLEMEFRAAGGRGHEHWCLQALIPSYHTC